MISNESRIGSSGIALITKGRTISAIIQKQNQMNRRSAVSERVEMQKAKKIMKMMVKKKRRKKQKTKEALLKINMNQTS